MKEKNTILVTGGAGYIGSQTCKHLYKAGYTPIVYDNFSRGFKENVKWGPCEEGDLKDKERLLSVFEKFDPIAVIHFGAFAYVNESVLHPSKYYVNNVYGTNVLLDSMLNAGCTRIIFSSSCATYGIPSELPIIESTAQNPINPYGFTKYIAEKMIADFAKVYDWQYVLLRYFNAAGADHESEIGELHEPETHLIPLVIKHALKDEIVKVFGNTFPTLDGTCIRDYIHVEDLADAHVKSLEYLINGNVSDVFNLGTGKGYSILEIIHKIESLLHKKINYVIEKPREGDPPILIANGDKINHAMSWSPTKSDIDNILVDAINWHIKK